MKEDKLGHTRITRSRDDKIRAEFQDNSEERDNMDHKINRDINDLLDELEQVEQDEYEMARSLLGRSSICNCVRPDALNEGDLLRISRDFIVLSRQLESATVHVEASSITVDIRRLDSVEPQPLIRHSQTAPKTSEGSAVDDEKVQSRNSVKDRIWGLTGKVKDGVQFISNVIKILEFFQPVFLMGLSVLGGS